jgi:hypothetical protein
VGFSEGSSEKVRTAGRTVICLTPVKCEARILDRFLRCTSLWADVILIADQGSDDGSREIAAHHPKVQLLPYGGADLDEHARTQQLLAAARRVPGPRVLVALDRVLTMVGW